MMYLKYTLIRFHTDNTKTDESSLKLCMCANTISPAASWEIFHFFLIFSEYMNFIMSHTDSTYKD